MGTKYSSQAASGFNASPPPDDGTTVASNLVAWTADVINKVGNPLNNFGAAINTQLVAFTDFSGSTVAGTYTTVANDHMRTLEANGTFTISLMDAATAGAGYIPSIKNVGSGVITVALQTAGNTLDGVANGTMTIPPKGYRQFKVNSPANGYLEQDAYSSEYAGIVIPFAGATAPAGFLLCDGSAVSRTTYANLFVVVSTTYGVGDGSTTFNVPNMLGRTAIGSGIGTFADVFTSVAASGNVIPVSSNNTKYVTGLPVVLSNVSGFTGLSNGAWWIFRSDSTHIGFSGSLANAQNGTVQTVTGTGNVTITWTGATRTLGEIGGEESHAMRQSELLSHAHTDARHIHGENTPTATTGGSNAWATVTGGVTTGSTSASVSTQTGTASLNTTGGNVAYNVMQPFLAMNWIIKT